ncbi:MAG: DUF4915 domain-containing protein [Calothrix sp. MO_167.B42]|nr:DUF4915 domain-containing protein [Calothrix sp. MO_167.B42]
MYLSEARCGLVVIDLRSGKIVHSFYLEGIVRELYDIAFLPGVQRPMAIRLKGEDIQSMVSIGM